MMKIIFAVAVFVLAVSAYKYSVPSFPCSFELRVSTKEDEKNKEVGKFTAKGRYLRVKIEEADDDKSYIVYRYDITAKQGGVDMLGVAVVEKEVCTNTWIPLDDYVNLLDGLHDSMFGALDDIDWTNKESVKYDGKKCTVYYMDDIDSFALYVYDDFPYAAHAQGSNDTIYEWDWDVSLDKFKLKECKSKFAETPDKKYAECGDSSSHSDSYDSGRSSSHKSSKASDDVASSTQAFATVVFGVIAACLVALF